MTESQQSKRGWFSSWRELRRARRQQYFASELHQQHHRAEDTAGMYGSTGPYGHSGPMTYGSAAWFGGDGGGCGGDGGGGGC